jgi:hypothetical protein
MDTIISTWEMNHEINDISIIREEIATDPSEPYSVEWDSINWN